MKKNKQKFNHYFEVILDVTYISTGIGLFTFTIWNILNHIQ